MINLQNLFNQAITCHQTGRIPEAINLYLRVLPMQRENDELLFTIGTAYCQIGQLEEGLNYLRKSSRINPKNFHTFGNMGRLLTDLRRFDEAVINYNKALTLNPNFPEALLGRGNALVEMKKYQEAIEDYNKALSLVPDFPLAHCNKGKALYELQQFEQALICYGKAVEIAPDFAEAFSNRGNTLKELNEHEQALSDYNKAIQLNPNLEGAYSNRGCVFEKLHRFDEALADYSTAIGLKPDYAEAYSNRGNTLKKLYRFDEALADYSTAIELKPDYAEAYSNRGNTLKELHRFDEALADYSTAIELKPDIDYLLGTKLHTQMHLCNWVEVDHQLQHIADKVIKKQKASLSFPLLAVIDSPDIHKAASEVYVKHKFPSENNLPESPLLSKKSKIRIAYFSADFHEHATMHLMAELFEKHDKDRFEFVAFSFGPIINDPWQLRAKDTFDNFVECHGQNDAEIAQLSRTLGIDIAVDLKGFTQNARTGIFAARAAPIQVNFIGYPGTMGANYIDYLIGDEVLIPQKSQHSYTEKIAYLPDCYQPNCRTREVSNKPISRSDFGLPEEGIVFSSFNNNYKITPQVFASWMRILKAVEGSVLWLFSSNTTAEENLRKHAEENGVDPKRIVFAQKLPVDEHLSRIPLADLMLDTFPYGAHTTCSDALRMGLPVVTLKGESFASRVAASLLTTVGLPELITESHSSYEDLAIELARNPKKLEEVRSRLENNIKSSPLFDPELFARNLESLYTTMYRRYQEGLPPDHIFASH